MLHDASGEPSGVENDRLRQERAQHWTDKIAERPQCANCGHQHDSAYCPKCGQKQLQDRLTLKHELKTAAAQVTDIDRGFLPTIWGMFTEPGVVARKYVEGKQRSFMNPLTYFLIGAAMQLLALWNVEFYIKDQMAQQLGAMKSTTSADAYEKLEKRLNRDPIEAFTESYFVSVQQGYTYVALFFFTFPMACLLSLLHRLNDEYFRVGETLIFSLFVTGQMLLVTAVATAVTVRLVPAWQPLCGPVLYFVLMMQAHGGFFKATWVSRLLSTVAMVFSLAVFITAIMLLFFLGIFLTIAFSG